MLPDGKIVGIGLSGVEHDLEVVMVCAVAVEVLAFVETEYGGGLSGRHIGNGIATVFVRDRSVLKGLPADRDIDVGDRLSGILIGDATGDRAGVG